MPVIAGEKPANERFPGAVSTFSIEAMMQDGKALQAGTSHYLARISRKPRTFATRATRANTCIATRRAGGVSTRTIGGVIMTHGDDGRLAPAARHRAKQIVIVPMLRDKPEDGALLEYGAALAKELGAKFALGEKVRVQFDTKKIKSAEKRWNWVRRGAPIIVEIGPRDMANGQVTFMRPRCLARRRQGGLAQSGARRVRGAGAALLEEIQNGLFAEAKTRMDASIVGGIETFADLEVYFGAAAADDDADQSKGWVRAGWCRPEGAALDAVDTRLKKLKLTLRNVPMDGRTTGGKCLFTGGDVKEDILIARSY